MDSVIQGAERSIIDVDRVALRQIYPNKKAFRFRNQCPSGFAPQLRVFENKHVLERAHHHGDVIFHRRRRRCRVDCRKAPADIDDVDGDAGVDDDPARLCHGLCPGARLHRLAADMEGYPELGGVMTCKPEDACGIRGLGPELSGKRQGRAVAGHRQPYEDGQVGGVPCLFEDLHELGFRIGDEDAYPEFMVGPAYCPPWFHGMQEGDPRLRKAAPNKFDLMLGCRVE